MLRCAAAARRCARVPRARRVLSDDASEFGFGGAANLRFTDVTHGERPRLQITEADGGGFTLLGDVYVPSSIIAMTFGALLWSPRTLAEITLESVAIFTVMHPRPGPSERIQPSGAGSGGLRRPREPGSEADLEVQKVDAAGRGPPDPPPRPRGPREPRR
mmetsp:Transcript_2966/g.10495  ORF Transcript_2966/g.10495 Transcript_2966/m.10495 type:complete len:160 (-) Transcript_2966:497-976(-)